MTRRLLLSIALLLLAACTTGSRDRFIATPVGFDQLAGWRYDDHRQALKTFTQSCPKLAAASPAASTGSGLAVPQPVWQSLCSEAMAVSPAAGQAKEFFERRFQPYRIANNSRTDGLFTGYYEPLIAGSRHKHGKFIYPVYAAPPELAASQPYFTRQQIDHGALAGRGLEIAWVDDPVMLFFMQVQGSGRLRLENGQQLLVGYAAKNGQPYVSLGKVMGDDGLVAKDKVDFFTIRQWLYAHPNEARAVMEKNPTYVFFRVLNGQAPVGSAGAPLTHGRSLAIDNIYIPYGLPLFLETGLPEPSGTLQPFQRLMVAQDSGTAIKGPVRGDIFFGSGKNAEYYAGAMKQRGSYSLLVPKEIAYQLR